MKVTLFLLFCHFLMVKIKSEKAVLWGSSNQRVLDQVNWDQNFWALFDDYLTLFHYIWNQKSLDAPTMDGCFIADPFLLTVIM